MVNNSQNLKVCITCPHLYMGGGVTNYYNVVKKYLKEDIHFFQIGAPKNEENGFEKISHLLKDIKRFRVHLKHSSSDYNLIHLNPSLDFKALIRDGILLSLAKNYDHKVLVSFHGWSLLVQNRIDKYFLPLFRNIYGRADAYIVLAQEFKEKLLKWGFYKPIFVETTPVDDELLRGFDLGKRLKCFNPNQRIQILFLARIIKSKGIFEAIYTIYYLRQRFPVVRLLIAGDGQHLKDAQKLVNNLGLNREVEFLGYIGGQHKQKAFANSDLYLFPSTHGEGMPTSVLEAMAFGLPIITYPVGGIKDFFEDGEHGYLVKTHDPHEIASLVVKLIESPNILRKISRYNHQYALKRFTASQNANRLADIYMELVGYIKKL